MGPFIYLSICQVVVFGEREGPARRAAGRTPALPVNYRSAGALECKVSTDRATPETDKTLIRD